jgi:hypothetical protein
VLPGAQAQCVDDPAGSIAAYGGCSVATAAIGCDTDLSTLDPRVPVGTFLTAAEGCPVSCGSCPDDPEDLDNPALVCTDDPAGVLVDSGGCAGVITDPLLGCDADLHAVNPVVAADTLARSLCPISCEDIPDECYCIMVDLTVYTINDGRHDCPTAEGTSGMNQRIEHDDFCTLSCRPGYHRPATLSDFRVVCTKGLLTLNGARIEPDLDLVRDIECQRTTNDKTTGCQVDDVFRFYGGQTSASDCPHFLEDNASCELACQPGYVPGAGGRTLTCEDRGGAEPQLVWNGDPIVI